MEQGGGKPGRFGDWSEIVIGACIEVHRHLGPGLLESAYERQKALPVRSKGIELQPGYRLDLVVGNQLVVELKSVERLLPVHEAQVITSLKLSGLGVGLLVNFHAAAIRHGLRRLTNHKILPGSPPSCDPRDC